ncbi:hypothetical protein L2E82_49817 [Cichorium intybus]|uniref:Uncharacterized protein n=1 Tax=Cichorium intybus TaxID=13427 RepID=A0ACB8Z272_CICIN|nr:hypothetical protein L2E82_49817 [Cichorium intybus]
MADLDYDPSVLTGRGAISIIHQYESSIPILTDGVSSRSLWNMACLRCHLFNNDSNLGRLHFTDVPEWNSRYL